MHRTDRDRETGAVCGLGPELEVDGRTYPTAVTGTIGAVLDGTPLTVTGCGAPVRLSAGEHQVRVIATDQYTATRLTLQPSTAGSSAVTGADVRDPARRQRAQLDDQPSGPRRGVRPGGAPRRCRRTSTPAGGPRSVGTELTPLRVDGWMQGYLLPAGDGGRVTLEFTPNRLYQAGLALGGLLALAARGGGGARWGAARSAVRADAPARRTRSDTAARAPVGVALAAAGPASPAPCWADRPSRPDCCVGDLGRRRIGDPGAVGAVLVGAAALAAGIVASQQTNRSGLPPTWCDALAGAGVGLVASVLLTRAGKRPGRG